MGAFNKTLHYIQCLRAELGSCILRKKERLIISPSDINQTIQSYKPSDSSNKPRKEAATAFNYPSNALITLIMFV